jgi:hypothetical protein
MIRTFCPLYATGTQTLYGGEPGDRDDGRLLEAQGVGLGHQLVLLRDGVVGE